ncbi:MAG: hypothetical protein RIK87_15565 [Fuerstiella sp.]
MFIIIGVLGVAISRFPFPHSSNPSIIVGSHCWGLDTEGRFVAEVPILIKEISEESVIEGVKPACGCTQATIIGPTHLSSGQPLLVNLTVDPVRAGPSVIRTDPERGKCQIKSTFKLKVAIGNSRRSLPVEVSGTCLLPAAFSPPELFFAQCCTSDPATFQTLTITPRSGWEVVDAESPEKCISTKITPSEGGLFDLAATLNPSLAPVDTRTFLTRQVEVRLKSSELGVRHLRVPVQFRVQPDVHFESRTVVLRKTKDSELSMGNVAVQASETIGSKFELLGARTDEPGIRVTLSSQSPNDVCVEAAAARRMSTARIVVDLEFRNDSRRDTIQAPLQVIVMDR